MYAAARGGVAMQVGQIILCIKFDKWLALFTRRNFWFRHP